MHGRLFFVVGRSAATRMDMRCNNKQTCLVRPSTARITAMVNNRASLIGQIVNINADCGPDQLFPLPILCTEERGFPVTSSSLNTYQEEHRQQSVWILANRPSLARGRRDPSPLSCVSNPIFLASSAPS
ncbi:hypothetical protein RvY_08110 [Ramazzottius varieornatus]|uniref:Uncharacterized protein n=1 Tax=Ramazzottius varieornatus TaxID=947166 RepID=A0A1D1V9G2_RAMVA|nr:hypothetical protein RvY_08110 [Ramazzottius varieornatus]